MGNTYGLEGLGLINPGNIYRNLPVARLVEMALARGEGVLASNGALSVRTGKYTGRSPNDRFMVDTPSVHDTISWGAVNQPLEEARFEALFRRLAAYLQGRDLFIFDGFVGADPAYRMPIRVVNQYAWQNLFVHQLFVRPSAAELEAHEPQFTVICAPGFQATPEVDGTLSEAFVVLNFDRRLIIIGGTSYAGEMKKSIFTVMNYLLPERGVCPMHCSANMGPAGDTALFFGLSGTGKTTLSADPERRLIGDDEHGWSDHGIFNFEGGCYAKCIKLSAEHEPQIWNAIRFGSVLENVAVDPDSRAIDYDCDALTENTRAAYPVDFIPNAVIPGIGGHPRTVVFLTADAFGVMPPIAKLTREQAMYHFLSGYTSKLAGTERGITDPQATFSTCFGAPFLPRSPRVYADLLGERIAKHGASVYLVNTGWTGGPSGIGRRMSLPYTRAMVRAAIKGELEGVEFVPDPVFGILVPTSCPGVPAEVLNPRHTWQDKEKYDAMARKLAGLFAENFTKFRDVPEEIRAAGPVVR
ncbi:Phosphoenolpyruvate carboxykinase [Moorella thermoacetica]|uniref:Phosphoenolpyruvate carboxykinase (ATP) n=1 Tax=Neomoorella thermoacetica TaxID=1525 RepID=A0AAC9MVL4_NEOTH|nr:phosphoenolpyruvate carboxykinase (ATP) [Moorella thermoacetica]AOQ24854.1 Phosphoenolpyruvate carboxykinase [ATP] [Moorella thermoacetica]TYL15605.1 Phosphoenolpyruvate carboxykinase [Moorella thermoacetica]